MYKSIFICFFLAFLAQSGVSQSYSCTPTDSLFWNSIKTLKGESPLKTWENVATHFIGKPYVAQTLEVNGDKELIINLSEVDCTTYLEYVLASVITLHQTENPKLADLAKTLTRLRYRDGIMKGYPSRLHYFSEWLADNAKKGLITEVSGENFKRETCTLSFMGTHRSAYPHLADDANFKAILALEKSFKPSLSILAKSKIEQSDSDLKHGDLIGLVTSIKGLDVSHTGFIYKKNGVSYLLHASSANKKVEISDLPLKDYLAKSKSTIGIVVYRLK